MAFLIVVAEFWNCCFVWGFSLSCRIFCAPFFPRMHGTPIEMSVSSYSPWSGVVRLMTRFLARITASAIMAITAAGA